LVRAMRRLAWTQQRFGWNARVVRALAANQLALDDCDAQAAFGERTRAMFAGCAAAEDDDVEAGAHAGSGLPDCSAIMYSAYQLGQSASRWPVRFPCPLFGRSARRIAL